MCAAVRTYWRCSDPSLLGRASGVGAALPRVEALALERGRLAWRARAGEDGAEPR